MKKPRIAVVTTYFPSREEPYRGHSTYQTLRHLTGLADWCAFVPFLRYPRGYRPKKSRYQRMDLNYRPADMDARYFEYVTLPLLGRPFNGELAYRAVRGAVQEFRPDLILNYWLYPDGYAAIKLGRQLGVPVVVASIGSDLRRLNDPFTRHWTRWTLGQAKRIITVSGELGVQATAMGAPPDRIAVILNGYDETVFYPGHRAAERQRLGLDADAEIVLYVGSLIPSKGLHELMEAFRELSARRPRLQLVCAGEGPLSPQLAATPRLVLPGKLSGPQVRDWMVAADLFCLPSYSEGCPNVVIEALACGRAVVATDVGGIPELVNDRNGVLVAPRDAAALAAGLEQALSARWDDQAVAASYRRDWRQVAAETWEVCLQALHS